LPKRPASALRSLLACLSVLAALTGAARADEALDPYVKLRAALVLKADADSLATAALMTPKDRPERAALLARAAVAAPQRPDLAWLNLAACVQITGCDVKPLEVRLRALDKDNGASWAGSLERAAPGSTELKVKLAEIADARRFDLYWNSLIVHTAGAIEHSGQADAATALVDAIGIGAAQAIPAFQKMSNACKGGALQDADMLSICRRLSVVLQHGDTVITQTIGDAIALRAFPEASPAYQQARAARRTARYRLDEQAKLPPLEGKAEPQRYLRLLTAYRTEPEVMIERLKEAGIDPNPPDGYPNPRF
jgi:hypothetical protein